MQEQQPLDHARAHELYWNTTSNIKAVAAKHGMTVQQLQKLAGPIDVGIRCKGCGKALLPQSRTERDGMLKAPPSYRQNWRRNVDYLLNCRSCYQVERERTDALNQTVEASVIAGAVLTVVTRLMSEGGESPWPEDDERWEDAGDLAAELLDALDALGVEVRLPFYMPEDHPLNGDVAAAFRELSVPDALPIDGPAERQTA